MSKVKLTLLILLILILIVTVIAMRKQSEENRDDVRDSVGYVITYDYEIVA